VGSKPQAIPKTEIPEIKTSKLNIDGTLNFESE
jgi:hypothetical protein